MKQISYKGKETEEREKG